MEGITSDDGGDAGVTVREWSGHPAGVSGTLHPHLSIPIEVSQNGIPASRTVDTNHPRFRAAFGSAVSGSGPWVWSVTTRRGSLLQVTHRIRDSPYE